MTFKVPVQSVGISKLSLLGVGVSTSFLQQKSIAKPINFSTTVVVGESSLAKHHPYHLVDPSPWPLLTSLSALWLALGLTLYFHQYPTAGTVLILAITCLIYTVSLWWRDVMRESLVDCHTDKVKRGLHLGMLLFIVTEAMFFVGLIWAFLHAALMPTAQIGLQWPPLGIVPVHASSWHDRPILNTWLLLASYFTANMAKHAMETNNHSRCSMFLALTIVLGAVFSFYQYLEYTDAAFTLSDSIFGSTFYMTTGMHGIHVIFGTLYLTVVLLTLKSASRSSSTALDLSILYWHFVDIIWVAVLILIYVWGGATPANTLELCQDGPCLLEGLLYDARLDNFSSNNSIENITIFSSSAYALFLYIASSFLLNNIIIISYRREGCILFALCRKLQASRLIFSSI
jgi:cytochrome c oxidase subunit 3